MVLETVMPTIMPAMVEGTATERAAADRVTRAIRAVAVGSALALIALCIAWELVWARTGHGTLVLKSLPLIAALPGLMKHRMYTYRWLSLAIWLYVAEGLVRITDRAPANWCAGAELALALVLFTACAAQVRWRHAVARRLPPADDARADAGTAH
jgi:uncharacterized membrane protein